MFAVYLCTSFNFTFLESQFSLLYCGSTASDLVRLRHRNHLVRVNRSTKITCFGTTNTATDKINQLFVATNRKIFLRSLRISSGIMQTWQPPSVITNAETTSEWLEQIWVFPEGGLKDTFVYLCIVLQQLAQSWPLDAWLAELTC